MIDDGPLRYVLMGCGYVVLYALAELVGAASQGATGPEPHVNVVAALGAILLTRLGMPWLAVLAAAPVLVLAALGGAAASAIAIRAASDTAAAMLIAALLEQWAGRQADLTRLRQVVAFLGAACLCAASLAAGQTLEWMARGGSLEGGPTSLTRLVLADCVALLSIGPLVLAWPLRRKWAGDGAVPIIETILQLLALSVILWEIYIQLEAQKLQYFYLLYLPLAWVATRHGQRGVALMLSVGFLPQIALQAMAAQTPQLAGDIQLRYLVLAVTGLLLGAMESERTLAEAAMMARQAELAHVQRLHVGWEMASALAHELNQPLTAAMNYCQAALRFLRAPQPDLGRAQTSLAHAIDSIEFAGRTTTGLRDLMRKSEQVLVAVNLADAVGEALRLIAGETTAAKVAVHVSDIAALPPVLADRTQVVQVLINVLRNAVQAIAASGREGRITLTGSLTDGDILIAIADNGQGLDAAIVDKLFQPFVSTKPTGMGLGLAVSKSIMEAHGGQLSGTSTPSGAVFTLHFPRQT